ncbi:MAG: dynamin family protein, partial [Myxococcota bacterium]
MITPAHRAIADRATELARALGDPLLEGQLRLLRDRVRAPAAWVTLLGETSTGKSTLLNGLLGAPVLPTAVRPTTGTIVQLVLEPRTDDAHEVVTQDGRVHAITPSAFEALTVQAGEDVSRITLRTGRAGRELDGLQLFDTPGGNALVESHDEVLTRFVPGSDLVLLVVGYRTGLGLADRELFQLVSFGLDAPETALLVVNRVPANANADDVRLQEIAEHAGDCLGFSPALVAIGSAPDRLPDTEALWTEVARRALSEEHLAPVRHRIWQALGQLVDEGRATIERRIAATEVVEAERGAAREVLQALEGARARANQAVQRRMDRLDILMPG